MAPNDAVMVTSWAGCDVVGAGDYTAPYEGACEDHEGCPGAVDHRARGYFDRPSQGDIRPRIGVVSFFSPFVFGCRTRLEQPLFLARGCRQDW